MNYKIFGLGALLISLLSELTIPLSAAPSLNFTTPTLDNITRINISITTEWMNKKPVRPVTERT